MARPDSAADLTDRTHGPGRLQSMGLQSRAGWVPEAAAVTAPRPAGEADDEGVPPSPLSPAGPTAGELAKAWLTDRLPLWTHGTVERASLGTVLTVLVTITVIVTAGVMVLHHKSAAGYSPSYVASSSGGSGSSYNSYATPTVAPNPVATPTSIVVDVGGRVRKPGLVTLPPGARVADAIAAAGGPLRHREIVAMNLAARVTDGQLLLVGVKAAAPGGSAAVAPSGSASSAAPVSLNSATLDELETLPGVGPVTGQKIIDWRTSHSGFTSVEQLQQVSGIGPATYAELSPLVTP